MSRPLDNIISNSSHNALAQLQVQPSQVRAQIETLHPAGEQPVGDGQLGVTVQGKESIELAVQEVCSRGVMMDDHQG